MGNPWAYDFSAIGNRTAPLLILIGSDDDAQERAKGGFKVGGNSDVYQLLPESFPFAQVNLSRQFLKGGAMPDPARFDCVLNLVTDPDQHPKTLERAGKLLRGYKGRVINRPDAVLRTTRDQVAKRLRGIPGLRVPGIVRLRNPKPGAASLAADRAGLAFPLIVRHAGTHTGKIVGVVEDAARLEAACTEPGTYFLIEYVDFQSADGLYRKCRFWSFGGQTIFRHMIVTDSWNVHVKDRTRFMLDRDDLIAEEVQRLVRLEGEFPDAVHATFDAVKQRMGLDFFGMDFALTPEGQVLMFEANATMSFFPLVAHPRFDYLGKLREPAQQAFMAMIAPGR